MVRTGWKSAFVLWLAAAFGWPTGAAADAPRDVTNSQRLWLDGLDIYGTDNGSGIGSRPSAGTAVTNWKDKSPNLFTATADSSTAPIATSDGVTCNGSKLIKVASGIFPPGTGVTAAEIFAVASTAADSSSFALYSGSTGSNHLGFAIPWGDTVFWDHNAAGGRLTTSWSGNGLTYNTTYLWNFFTGGTVQAIAKNGTNLAVLSYSPTYTPDATHSLSLCGGDGGYYNGSVSEVIVYSRRLLIAEKNIILSYLAAKYANPGGAGALSKYTPPGSFRYHVGGIGQDSDGSLTTGTSAGLTIANGTFLSSGRYLLAGVDSISPSSGTTTADVPTGYTRRSSRVWYLQRTVSGGGPGNVSLTFNLAQLGISATSGTTLAVASRTGTSGQFSTVSTATYNGSGTVTFSVTGPATGYYVLAGTLSGTPKLALNLGTQVLSDAINTSNFKAIPGSLVRGSALVTNTGDASPDSNSTVFSLAVPTNAKFYLGDIGTAGSGPVTITQGSPSSALTYTYTSLGSTTDGLDFSDNSGTSWTYSPTPDAQQADAAITNVRVRLSGTFATGTSPNFPSFTVNYGVVVK